jgi:membrane-bound lytic murein transglycosylase B
VAVSRTSPACNLRWTTLAGIGLIESNHGRASGSTLGNNGVSSPPIIGAPLDGQAGRQAVPDTDGGRLDGDRTWDRAIGPMQFIPSTWTRYAVDADRDGVADPQDIDDAALAAATYLCAGGRDLSTVDGWWAAIMSYNNVSVYATNVFGAANDYGIRSRT